MAAERLYVFHGPDGFSAREAARSLREQLQVAPNNVIRLDGRASVAEIASATQTASFFAEPRLVIIEGLADRFSGRRRQRGRQSRSRATTADAASEVDQLIEVFSNVPDSTTIVLLEEGASPAFLEAFKDVAKVTAFALRRPDDIKRWADARVRERGGSIAPAAIDLLCEMVDGSHLGELAQEIDKLLAYTDGRRIEVADVEEVGSGAISHQIWDLTDAVVAGRADRALAVLQRMDEREHPRQLLLSMIVRQYRQVLVAQSMLKEGFPAPRIGERLGIFHPYPLQKAIDTASRYPADRLERAYRRLLEADVAVKTGVMDIDTALDVLIVDLAEITNAGRRRPYEPAAGRRRY